MKPKSIIAELVTLIIIYIAIRLFVFLLTGTWRNNATIDIDLLDTYFVIGQTSVVIPAFLMLTTIVYLLKEGFYHYKRKAQNLILIIANLLFLIALYPLSTLVNMIPKPAWTLYPPLSALPKATSLSYNQNVRAFFFIKQITPGMIIIFMLILVISAILTGKNWNIHKHEHQTP
ncbi:hypothetical protein [Mucilaginibacter sp. SP1R1]|uniref:hypothetical protein n=1 Tax=Mucilaginibacter sp. SP1R1 TaxID=2723091 RepID=UPI001610F1AE|nr:hypothetical protein [Mucilaginibacter sp. SP1R1]MBB6152219.1 heme/copper-type cytochrome/quinol oxidase subunit 1 [Mucilaginibacter sp. SP1R1]